MYNYEKGVTSITFLQRNTQNSTPCAEIARPNAAESLGRTCGEHRLITQSLRKHTGNTAEESSDGSQRISSERLVILHALIVLVGDVP